MSHTMKKYDVQQTMHTIFLVLRNKETHKMEQKFTIFDNFMGSTMTLPRSGTVILAISDENFSRIDDILQLRPHLFRNLPNLTKIISNHIIIKMNKSSVETLSGATFNFDKTNKGNFVEGIAVSTPISHILKASGKKYVYTYLSLDGMLLTDDDLLEIKFYMPRPRKSSHSQTKGSFLEGDPSDREYGLPQYEPHPPPPSEIPPQPKAIDKSFRERGFYKVSVKKLNYMRQNDIFAWMCIQSYMTSPFINTLLFKVQGDLTRFDQRFFDIGKEKPNIHQVYDPLDPYNIFKTFFKSCLVRAKQLGKPLTNPRDKNKEILTQTDMIRAYPEMGFPLTMFDKAEFTRKYVLAIQNAIFTIPPLERPVYAWRGYAPINLPDTMAQDVRALYIGQEITNWAFMSISFDPRIASMFVKQELHCCTLRIHIPPKFSAFMISSDSSDHNFPKNLTPWTEQEILLAVGCVFRVVQPAMYVSIPSNYGGTINTFMVDVDLVGIRPIRIR